MNSIALRLVCDAAAVRHLGISKIPVSERDFAGLVMDFIHAAGSLTKQEQSGLLAACNPPTNPPTNPS